MTALSAIVFDFDGVVADCQRGSVLPGAAAFVRQASDRVPIGIASGATTAEIRRILQASGLDHLFAAIVGVDQTARTKPSPDPFLEVLQRMRTAGHEVHPTTAVAIDDSIAGLVAARTAGLRCVGIADAARQSDVAPYAELIVSGLQALTLDTLDNLVRT